MKLYNALSSYSKKSSVITIGTFDGVHIGHQKIIDRLCKVAIEKDLDSVILTFFPHPRMVLQPDSNIQLLNTIKERETVLSETSLQHLIVKTFTKDFANLSAREFVKEILVDALNAKHIIIGYDHHFGKNRSANIDDLKAFGNDFGFEVEEISAQDVAEVAVSSTKIRNALDNGDIHTANAYLGYDYFLTGKVVKGKGLGKKLHFPTANLHIKEDYKLIPKHGVYVVRVTVGSLSHYGMMNIGTNPTVSGIHRSIEVHLFDFDASIYDFEIKVEILTRLRDEQKFESVELLKNQLNKDKVEALNFIASSHDK